MLNKSDLVSADNLASTQQWLAEGWPEAFVLTTTQGQLEPEVVFGRASTRTYDGGGDHHPERTFVTETLTPKGALSREQVEDLMDSLPPETTVRAKGLVQIVDEPEPFVLQRVGKRWSLLRSNMEWPAEPESSIVVIAIKTAPSADR